MVRVHAVGARWQLAIPLGLAIAALGCGGDDNSGGPDGGPTDGGAAGDGGEAGGDAAASGDGGSSPQRVVLLFGGESEGAPLGDTWSWDGQAWAGELVATRPGPRRGAAMAYDAERDRAVLFGGEGGGGDRGDTWEWDGSSWSQAGAAPGELEARSQHALAYDGARARVVLFGGSAGETLLGDTWFWDGASWEEASVDAAIPARAGHAMAYDAANGEVVVFGGDGGGPPALADTWVRGDDGWSDVSPEISPSGRSRAALAYDPVRERIVLFGGAGGEGLLGDTWEWNGEARTWTEIEVSGSEPAARSGHALVFDPVTQRVVLFGGTGAGGEPLAGTFAWTGSAWERVSGDAADGPARARHALARSPGS